MSGEPVPNVSLDDLYDQTRYRQMLYPSDIAEEGDLYYEFHDLIVRRVAQQFCINTYFNTHVYFHKILVTPKGNKVI